MEYGAACTPECNDGYEKSTEQASCIDGTLTNVVCTALSTTCTDISNPVNGSAGTGDDSCGAVTALATGESCVPACNDGYSLSTIAGQSTTSCLTGILTAATCVKDCTVSFATGTGNPTLGTENGSCRDGTLAAGKSCTPVCASGYTLSGATSCSAAGEVTLSTCVADDPGSAPPTDSPGPAPPTDDPGPAPPTDDPVPVPPTDDPVPVPAAACAYEPPDNGSDGKQNDDGSCKSVVTNGDVRQLASGKTCTPECDDGFELSGVMKSSCSAEGQFTRATCLPIDNTKCTVTLPETFIAGSCPNTLFPGEVCQPECEQGYEAIGMTMCSDFGELTMTECVMPTPVLLCDSSEPPKNGDVGTGETRCSRTMEAGTTCSPRCDRGFVVSGVTTCSDMGVLDSATCIAEDAAPDCDASEPPENGSVGDCTDSLASGSSCQPDCNDGFEADGTSKCYAGALTAATCVEQTCGSDETAYGDECFPNAPGSGFAFLDEFMTLGLTPKSTLTSYETGILADELGALVEAERGTGKGGKAREDMMTTILYAPKTGDDDSSSPEVPAVTARRLLLSARASGGSRRRGRRLTQVSSLSMTLVVRFEVAADDMSDTSAAIGRVFATGDALETARAVLGPQFEECTLRSTAARRVYWKKTKGVNAAVVDVLAARTSNQLVAAEDDPCLVANGGCVDGVSCTADPGAATGVSCGACPSGLEGDGHSDGTGCSDRDECSDMNLVNGGCSPLVTCTNVIGGRLCGACPAGYDGDGVTCADIDECAKRNGDCDRRTQCTNTAGGRTCGACPAGYKGTGDTKCVKSSGCEVRNGGCHKLVTCSEDANGNSVCGACPAGYEGDGTWCLDYDACVDNPCAAGVHCKDDKAPSMGRTCGKCPAGQLGDGETCKENPCFIKNGGCDPLTKCSADDVTGDATCGPCPKGYGRNPNDQFALCANVDGCANSPCFAGVLCTDAAPPKEGFTCGSCPIGYEGDGETCADVDECATNNGGCLDGTTCTNTPGGRTCGACPAGYKGSGETGCTLMSACAVKNGGCDPLTTCTDNGSGGSTCGACPAGGGYSGDGDSGCVDIDGCANSPCFAGVTCTDVPAPGTGYTCGKCPIGYEGDGVTCTLCKMSVSIAATTIVNGAVPRGGNTRVVGAIEKMDAACTATLGYTFGYSASRSDGTEVVLDPSTTYSNTPNLFIPKKSLPPGVAYTFRFEGRVEGNPAVASYAEFDFVVRAAPLEAVIVGGDVLLTEGVPLTLDASSSIDPDEETEYDWAFAWTCEALAPVAGDCLDADGYVIDLPASARIESLQLVGAAGAGQTYAIALVATKGARSATTESGVTVVSAAAGATGAPPSVSIPPLPGQKVNAGDVARLQATVLSEAAPDTRALLWSATRVSDDDGSVAALDLLGSVSGSGEAFISSSSLTTKNLVLSPNALETGYTYTFRLDVTDANGAAAAFVTLAENTPPGDGSVMAVPSEGVALSTTFRVEAIAWTDDDKPLQYKFTSRVVGDETAEPDNKQDFSPKKYWEGILPGGLEAHGRKIALGVQVMDALGAVSAVAEATVVVTWPALASEEAATEAMESAGMDAAALRDAGQYEEANSLVSVVMQQDENFKTQQRRRKLLSANGCVGGGGRTRPAARRRDPRRASPCSTSPSRRAR